MNSRAGISRRDLLLGGLAGAVTPFFPSIQSYSGETQAHPGIPGPYRGCVVAVRHSGSLVSGAFQERPIQAMIRQGMTALTGSREWVKAWRSFFEPGDVVGIKVNPVGAPHVVSCAEVIHQIVAGLQAAGVKSRDIVVYDRFRDQFRSTGFIKMLPEGVRWSAAVETYELVRLDRRRGSDLVFLC